MTVRTGRAKAVDKKASRQCRTLTLNLGLVEDNSQARPWQVRTLTPDSLATSMPKALAPPATAAGSRTKNRQRQAQEKATRRVRAKAKRETPLPLAEEAEEEP